VGGGEVPGVGWVAQKERPPEEATAFTAPVSVANCVWFNFGLYKSGGQVPPGVTG
jgi:hypothetical protein